MHWVRGSKSIVGWTQGIVTRRCRAVFTRLSDTPDLYKTSRDSYDSRPWAGILEAQKHYPGNASGFGPTSTTRRRHLSFAPGLDWMTRFLVYDPMNGLATVFRCFYRASSSLPKWLQHTFLHSARPLPQCSLLCTLFRSISPI